MMKIYISIIFIYIYINYISYYIRYVILNILITVKNNSDFWEFKILVSLNDSHWFIEQFSSELEPTNTFNIYIIICNKGLLLILKICIQIRNKPSNSSSFADLQIALRIA